MFIIATNLRNQVFFENQININDKVILSRGELFWRFLVCHLQFS
jgi:hypothetical protein